MNIIYFIYEFPPQIFGGLGTYAAEISKEIIKRDKKLTVITVNWNQDIEVDDYQGVKVYRPKVVDMADGLSLFVHPEFKSWGEWLKFLSKIVTYNLWGANFIYNLNQKKEEVFDLAVSHDWLGIMGGVVVKKSLNIPHIFHIHSTEEGRQQGGGSVTIKNIEKEGALASSAVITVSYAMKQELIRALGVPEEKIYVAWNGVDAEKYNPNKVKTEEIINLRQSYGIKDEDLMILFLGRLTEIKGIRQLLFALPQVIKDYPNVKLVVVGKGELEEECKHLLLELNIAPYVIMHCEFLSEDLRILHYAASDLCIFPSLYEPFGIVSLEAMAMGTPVVVGAEGTSGFKEQVITEGDNMCGVHINPYLPSSIAWGIKLILQMDRKKLGENARKRVEKYFTWEKTTDWTLKIYEEVRNLSAATVRKV